VIVVLGANEPAHRTAIEHYPVTVVFNTDWAKGMGNSLKAGLRYVESDLASLQAVLLMVCDQPLLTASHLDRLIERYRVTGKPIVASHYSGARGVPALFDKAMFPKLHSMDDQHGAKKIINSSNEFVEEVEFPEGSIDLDTPEDKQRFFSSGR
jgi:molybdenum cofactor cytidylyltransferase